MIPAIDLARAEERQRIIHEQRQSHRDCLKVIEIEDQALKAIIKHGRAYQKACEALPLDALAAIAPVAAEDEPASGPDLADDGTIEPQEAVEEEASPDLPMPADFKPLTSVSNEEAEAGVLDVLTRYADGKGVCTMSISGICTRASLNFSGATNAVNRLIKQGRIRRVSAKGATWAHEVIGLRSAPAPQPGHEVSPAASNVAKRMMTLFEAERSGSVSSVRREKLLRLVGSSGTKLRQMLKHLEAEGLIKVARSSDAEGKEEISVILKTPAAKVAAE